MSNILKCSFCGKGRGKVDQMIQGPVINNDINLYICNECIDYSYDVIHELEKDMLGSFSSDHEISTLSPEEIKAQLDNYIIGQDLPKIAMSIAMYNHCKRINRSASDVDIDKTNLLMIGPSGSGKTLMVKTIAKLFKLPCVIADANTLTESGYVGQDVDSLIERLIHEAGGDIELAQKGIIFLDEIDKKARRASHGHTARDVSGEGVQQGLLKLIEGTVIRLPETYTRTEAIEIDTSNILFVFSGAFIGLDEIINQSRNSTGVGFSAQIKNKTLLSGITKEVNSQDLINYGFIPEFVGRVPAVVVFDEIDVASLERILTEPKNSIVSQFRELFKMDGVELVFDDKYLHSVAEDCIKQKIGARGLRGIIERTLQSTQFILPRIAKEGVIKIIINGNGLPTYIHKPTRKRKTINE